MGEYGLTRWTAENDDGFSGKERQSSLKIETTLRRNVSEHFSQRRNVCQPLAKEGGERRSLSLKGIVYGNFRGFYQKSLVSQRKSTRGNRGVFKKRPHARARSNPALGGGTPVSFEQAEGKGRKSKGGGKNKQPSKKRSKLKRPIGRGEK